MDSSCNRNSREADGVPVNILRISQAPQRTPVKPGKVVGPVVQYANGNIMSTNYDPQAVIRSTVNTVIPPQGIPPPYYHRTLSNNQESTTSQSQSKQVPNCGITSKLTPEVAININNPFYMTRVGLQKLNYVDDKVVAIDANMLQAKAAQYSGDGASAGAHSKVGSVRYELSGMY